MTAAPPVGNHELESEAIRKALKGLKNSFSDSLQRWRPVSPGPIERRAWRRFSGLQRPRFHSTKLSPMSRRGAREGGRAFARFAAGACASVDCSGGTRAEAQKSLGWGKDRLPGGPGKSGSAPPRIGERWGGERIKNNGSDRPRRTGSSRCWDVRMSRGLDSARSPRDEDESRRRRRPRVPPVGWLIRPRPVACRSGGRPVDQPG